MANTSASGGYLAPDTMIVDDDALTDIITAAVAGVTGLPGNMVRPRWQPKPPPRPAALVDWCAVGIVEDDQDDNPVVVHDGLANGGLGQDVLMRQESFQVLASFYGPNAKGYAKRLRDGLYISQNREQLQQESISFVSASTIRALPEQVGAQWLDRFDLPLFFRRAVNRVYEVQSIASSDIDLNNETEIVHISVNP